MDIFPWSKLILYFENEGANTISIYTEQID